MPPLSSLRNIILDLPWKIMISNRIQDESAPKIVDYYDVTEAAWPSSVTNLHVQYLDQMSKRKCQRGCMFVSQKGSGCKAYWWSWYDGPKKSQNTEPLILSNIHFISPIQFDYFSKIISAFFGPCLGFPFKQTLGVSTHGETNRAWTQSPERSLDRARLERRMLVIIDRMECNVQRLGDICQNRRTVTQELGGFLWECALWVVLFKGKQNLWILFLWCW